METGFVKQDLTGLQNLSGLTTQLLLIHCVLMDVRR